MKKKKPGFGDGIGSKVKFYPLDSKVLKPRRRHGRSGLRNISLFIIVILIIGGAIFFGGHHLLNALLIRSSYSIDVIEIHGNRAVSEEIILNAAKAVKGANLFSVDIYEAKESIEGIPQIASASVKRLLPGTLRIEVVERIPRAVIKGEKEFSLDPSGVILPPDALTIGTEITNIYGVQVEKGEMGSLCSDKTINKAMNILALYDNSRLKGQIAIEALYVNADGNIELWALSKVPSHRRFTIFLGTRDYPQQIANLIEILNHEFDTSGPEDRIINLTYDRPLSAPAGPYSERRFSVQ